MPPHTTRELARTLVAHEVDAATRSLRAEPATVRVYERLRRQLAATMGVDGFQALASRALALAKSESPRLSAVQVTANGGLRGFDEVESGMGADEDGEAGVVLIEQLLGLFLAFLGEATTLRLIEDLRLQFDDRAAPAALAADKPDSGIDRLVIAAVFGDLLLEVDRLRSVSEHIEILANKHPDMEDGLVSVAGNIRSIASVLDVFLLIRSQAGDSQPDVVASETNRYMN